MPELLSILKSPTRERKPLGEVGESLAADFIKQNGYRVVMTNFKVPVGRNSKGVQVTGEIDIIALDGETLCFIEVKTRRSEEFTPIETNVDLRKQRQITRTALVYRKIFSIYEMEHRYDVVTVLLAKGETPYIELTKGFWSNSTFRKTRWRDGIYRDLF